MNLFPSPLCFIKRRVLQQRIRLEGQVHRWRLAFAYGRNALSKEQAQTIVYQCEHQAGWYPLSTLCDDDVLAVALDTYEDHPALAGYIADGCARVSRKCDGNNDSLSDAQDWAIEEAIRYAHQDGIQFTECRPDAEVQS